MRIAVVSDSHQADDCAWWESVFARYLKPADAVLHCGDITGLAVYASLMRHRNAHAVAGNCDWALAALLPAMRRLHLAGHVVGLTHGWGGRRGVARRVAEAMSQDCDLACFGHTHQRYFSAEHGLWLLNPGSLAEGSMAWLFLEPGQPPRCRFVDVQQP